MLLFSSAPSLAPAEKNVTAKIITSTAALQTTGAGNAAQDGMSIDDLKQHIERFAPRPQARSRYNPSQSQYVIPDVYVVKVEDQYVAVLNEEGLPQLRISPVYRRLLDKSVAENTDETRAYVKDKFRSALWLIKSVEQRQKTIHKVATSIINFQRDFLDHGIEHLRPPCAGCRQRRAHESTVAGGDEQYMPRSRVSNEVILHALASSLARRSHRSKSSSGSADHRAGDRGDAERLQDCEHPAARRANGARTIAKYREQEDPTRTSAKSGIGSRLWAKALGPPS